MKYHCACRLLSSYNLSVRLNGFAKKILMKFVKGIKGYYGKSSLSMNVHNLLHVANDARIMNDSLIIILAFPFENFLEKLTLKLRSSLTL